MINDPITNPVTGYIGCDQSSQVIANAAYLDGDEIDENKLKVDNEPRTFYHSEPLLRVSKTAFSETFLTFSTMETQKCGAFQVNRPLSVRKQ